ncbi:hypothetical protein ABENE_07345 [Asticcacaulis benevestitus DSM 16100 = ATCC BAA-896]|uniref:PBS lyase n=1 Tax=Asticcacaulis benevestitus DSM 16100 = ATCC BAA-896 TaxID=1121022 RepID=V4Q492_9CAUL|nr:hypothetical protein ABENE_07345 [Asticcacaulis benevestitus DSM 16100 = ATCC BAA-896]
MAEEPRASVRAAILNTLIRLRSADVIRGLVEHLRSENATLRNEVIEVLQDMPDEAMPILEQLLTDWDSDVRIFTANILSETKHPRTPDVLIGVIKSDPHVNVCMAALDGLLEIGDESMIDSIQQLGERFPEAPFVKFAVSLAIKRLQGVDYARGTT